MDKGTKRNVANKTIKIVKELDSTKKIWNICSALFPDLEKNLTTYPVDVAFQVLILHCHYEAFINALEDYGLNDKVHDSHLTDLKTFKSNQKYFKEFKASQFDISKFETVLGEDILQKIIDLIEKIIDSILAFSSTKGIDLSNAENIKTNIINYLESNRKEIYQNSIEENKELFSQLTKYYQSKKYQTDLRKNRLTAYEEKLAAKYTSKQNWLGSNFSIEDIYVEPSYVIFYQKYNKSVHEYFATTFITTGAERLTIVLGQPGQGKTSFCKRLLYDYLNPEKRKRKAIMNCPHIYFLRFSDIKEELGDKPLAAIKRLLAEEIYGDADVALEKEALIVLDGLDEYCLGKPDEHRSLLNELIREISRKENAETRLLITSRTRYVNTSDQFLQDACPLIIELSPFEVAGQKLLFNKYKSVLGEKVNLKDESIIDEIHQNYAYLQDLINLPVLLLLIYHSDIDIRSESIHYQSSIYDKLFSNLISRAFQNEKKHPFLKETRLDEAKLRSILREIAFTMFQCGALHISNEQLEEILKEHLNKEYQEEQLKLLFQAVLIGFYWQKNEKGNLEFLHRTLQEYLVAEYIWLELQKLADKQPDGIQYVIADGEEFFDFTWRLFSRDIIYPEPIIYISEIINSKRIFFNTQIDPKSLCIVERLINQVKYNSDRDFLNRINLPEIRPIQFCRNHLWNYWHTLMAISQTSIQENIVFKEEYIEIIQKLIYKTELTEGNLFLFANLKKAKMKKMDLWRVDLTRKNLTEADLTEASLYDANIKFADLTRAILINADLSDANLTQAILTDSNLTNCDLTNANLTNANLSGCNLANANLMGANLTGANLMNVNLEGAILIGANPKDADNFDKYASKANVFGAKIENSFHHPNPYCCS